MTAGRNETHVWIFFNNKNMSMSSVKPSDAARLKVEEIVNASRSNATVNLSRRDYGRAFVNFIIVAKLDRSKRTEIQDDFILATREWTEDLINKGQIEELFSCYAQAVEFFPNTAAIFNNIGAQLFRLGYVEDAAQYIRKALKLNPVLAGARENFDNICGHLVERWHFRMLNDVRRNRAYQRAIDKAVDSGRGVVLDIGAGTGLLSLFAVDAGADAVYSCEKSKTMHSIAVDVIAANGMADKISLTNKPSYDLSIPSDLPQRVQLVITETFDAALFGEQVLSTLNHAWSSLLAQDGTAAVIPACAQVYVCGIECDAISRQNRFVYPCLEGLDCSTFDLICDTGSAEEEPYTTEDLRSVHGGFRQLTAVTPLVQVDFNNPQNIAKLLNGVSEDVSCPVTSPGRLDALAVWFDLHLDEVTTISTSPATENCWHQAVFPVFSSHIHPNRRVEQTTCVRQGEVLVVRSVCENDRLCVHCTQVCRAAGYTEDRGAGQVPSKNQESALHTFGSICNTAHQLNNTTPGASLMLTKDSIEATFQMFEMKLESNIVDSENFEKLPTCTKTGLGPSNYDDLSPDCVSNTSILSLKSSENERSKFLLSRETIGTLNDMTLNRCYCQALKQIQGKLIPSHPSTGLTLLTFQKFSFNGLQALRLGFSKLLIYLSEDSPEETTDLTSGILTEVMKQNDVESGRVEVLTDYLTEREPEERAQCLVVDMVEPSGVLYQQVLEAIALMRVTCLAPGGVVVPGGVCVYGLLIESLDLEKSSAVVGDTWTMGYQIAGTINEFKMMTHVDIDLSTLSHRRLSQPIQLLDLQFNSDDSHEQESSHVPSFLSARGEVCATVTETGTLTAIVYWFGLQFSETVQLSTFNSGCHWRQAAIMVPGEITLQADQTLYLDVSLKNSCLHITPKKQNA